MKRSDVLQRGAAMGLMATISRPGVAFAADPRRDVPISPLVPAPDGVPVAFLLSDGAVVIDFAGPWEVFCDADVMGRQTPAFSMYTVAETTKPITTSGGMKIVPQFALAGAPAPKVVVVPAQSDPTPAVKDWLVRMAAEADLVMSVCTGALVLAQAGLLNGRAATTHHSAFTMLAMRYPDVTVVRGARFVDNGRIATSAGLSAGIDLSLHVVARYYGKDAARQTAYDMEYLGTGYLDGQNATFGKAPSPRGDNAVCPVCWMAVAKPGSPSLVYRGTTYYFCMAQHEQLFAAAPRRFLDA